MAHILRWLAAHMARRETTHHGETEHESTFMEILDFLSSRRLCLRNVLSLCQVREMKWACGTFLFVTI